MKLEVLVATMHQNDHSILEKMNIQTDAVIVNQCDRNEFEEIKYKGNSIRFLSLAERGVGLSRNTALMRAKADICLFADDDVSYKDGYKEIIVNEFVNNPKADIIIFNVPSTHEERGKRIITKSKKLQFHNCFRFGTYQIAIKLASIRKANIHFSLLFGGGAKYSSGEDSLFLKDCLNNGLALYSSPKSIGSVSHKESTWFKGYTEKYFIDKGVLYACLSRRWVRLLCLQFVLRHRRMFEKDRTWKEAFELMLKGTREIRR